jgi:hypothetical protein
MASNKPEYFFRDIKKNAVTSKLNYKYLEKRLRSLNIKIN